MPLSSSLSARISSRLMWAVRANFPDKCGFQLRVLKRRLVTSNVASVAMSATKRPEDLLRARGRARAVGARCSVGCAQDALDRISKVGVGKTEEEARDQ